MRAATPQVFYDPKAKYIWAMAFSKTGDLFVATGDQGEIHRVTPAGAGSVFFRTEETHARSLAMDANDNLIVGTDPSGLILRVTPAGEGFVLYQAPKREITAVAVAPDGTIYAAGVGNRQAVRPARSCAAPGSGACRRGTRRRASRKLLRRWVQPAPAIGGAPKFIAFRRDGYPRKIWSTSQDLVYALAFDAQGRLLVGTGNHGQRCTGWTPTIPTRGS